MIQVRLQVIGKVQGVWFRAYTRDCAIALQLRGWVCNEPDGSVHIVAVGTREKIDQFINQIKTGSPQSRVDNVHISEEALTDQNEFVILK
jgi:acylphosphatase